MSVPILDKNGAWVGVLRLNKARPVTFNAVQGFESGTPCEIIAISTGTANNFFNEAAQLEEWHYPRRPNNDRLFEFYNVLWIEWKGNVAYRKALGRVLKITWEQVDRELIDVVLG
jgi:hypothetical protein